MEVGDWRPIDEWGHDAQWADRSHHELHVLLTGEREGYYCDYGSVASLADDLAGAGHDPRRSVICAQNHDQVGNRALGDRLPEDALRVAAAVTLFSPCTPLLFMGEEHFETAPFQFFTDHIDPAIAEATREGRQREFADFTSFSGEEVPDPQALETFLRSKLHPREPDPLYRELLALRRELPRELEAEADEEAKVLRLRRGDATLVADFGNRRVEFSRLMKVWPGKPFPLGATWDGEGTNFSLFSEHAERVELCLFDGDRETRVELQRRNRAQLALLHPGHRPRPAVRLPRPRPVRPGDRATASTRTSS